MIVIVIFSVFLLIISIIGNLKANHALSKGFFTFFLIITSMFLYLTLIFYDDMKNPKPNAIDVYRGNTELKITKVEKNGILIEADSIVVFK